MGCSDDSEQAAGGFRFHGQNARGVGCEERARTLHPARPFRFVNGVAVSRDGRRAISASWDETVKVWDLENGSELRTLKGHAGWVYGVALTGRPPTGDFRFL